jgi:hypothetical protein
MRFLTVTILLLGLAITGPACTVHAQETAPIALHAPQPVEQHQWLQQFVGEWNTESKAMMGTDQPPIECTGTLSSRKLGGFWVINEMKGDMMGQTIIGVQTIGYDPDKQKYIGTWADSVSSFMWHYIGEVDATGKTLTLEAEGPNFMGDGKPTKFHDVYQFKSADEIAISSKMLASDGKWITFMSGTAKRRR